MSVCLCMQYGDHQMFTRNCSVFYCVIYFWSFVAVLWDSLPRVTDGVSAKTENTFISAVIHGHCYCRLFVVVLAMVVLAVIY